MANIRKNIHLSDQKYMKAQGLMGTAAEGGGLTEGNPAVESAWVDKDFRISGGDGSASFAGTVLSHNQISTAMTGVPFAGLPANLNPWPDVYFVSTACRVMSCLSACHIMSRVAPTITIF